MSKRYDDYIFEGRNKKYGAYKLRKYYEKNLYTGFLFTIAVFVIMSLLWYDYTNSINFSNPIKDEVVMVYIKLPPLDKPTNTIISESKPKLNKKTSKPTSKLLSETIHKGDITIDSMVYDNSDTTKVDTILSVHVPNSNETINYDMGHISPIFFVTTINSIEQFDQYLENNISYPELALKNKAEGTVYIHFMIDSIGHPTNIRVIKGFGHGCDEEAIRLVTQSPKWTLVSKEFMVQVKFRL